MDAAASATEGDIGAPYYTTHEIGIGLRCYDGSNHLDGYVGLSIQFDATQFGA